MSEEFIATWRKTLAERPDGTHYDGCHLSHPSCALSFATDEIVRLRAEVEQLESAWTFINIWKGRYESERALADQLAEAAKAMQTAHDSWCEAHVDDEDESACFFCAALAAHEAARNPMTLDEAIDTLGTVHK
jgi:hypothetical protein